MTEEQSGAQNSSPGQSECFPFGKTRVLLYHNQIFCGEKCLVYRANHSDPGGDLALKLFDTAVSRSTIEQELGLLQQWNHPQIIRLHRLVDAKKPISFPGRYQTEMNCRYGLLMDRHVCSVQQKLYENDGVPFDPQEAAETIRNAAKALAYVHSQEYLHRDIKLANLLFSKSGDVILTDFELAKPCDSETGTSGDSTTRGKTPQKVEVGLGTPQYSSPEQIRGAKLTYASDIYSLGICLYELLTKTLPFESANDHLLIELIETTNPPLPRKKDKNIPRKLESIYLKCVEKNPELRYQSAEELVADLDRWLNGDKFRVKRPSQAKRAGRWVRKERWKAATVAVVIAGVLLGIVMQYRYSASLKRELAFKRENDEILQQSRELVWELLELNEEFIHDQPGLQGRERELLRVLLAHEQNFQQRRPSDPELTEALARSHLMVGRIQLNLQEYKTSLESLQKAEALFHKLTKSRHARWDTRASLVIAIRLQGAWYSVQEKTVRVRERSQTALEIVEDILDDHPDNPVLMIEKARNLINYASTNRNSAEKRSQYQQAAKLLEEARSLSDENREANRVLSGCYANLSVAARELGQIEESLGYSHKAEELLKTLLRSYPRSPVLLGRLARVHHLRGDQHTRLEQFPQALEEFENALQLRRQLWEENPAQDSYRRDLAHTCHELAQLLTRHRSLQSQVKNAESRMESLLQETIRHQDWLAAQSDLLAPKVSLSTTQTTFALYLIRQKQPEQAIQVYLQAAKALESVELDDKNLETWKAIRTRCAAISNAALLERSLQKYETALARVQSIDADYRELYKEKPIPRVAYEIAKNEQLMGHLLVALERFAEAYPYLESAADTFQQLQDSQEPLLKSEATTMLQRTVDKHLQALFIQTRQQRDAQQLTLALNLLIKAKSLPLDARRVFLVAQEFATCFPLAMRAKDQSKVLQLTISTLQTAVDRGVVRDTPEHKDLQNNPVWAPLRDQPAFQKFLQEAFDQ